MKVVVKLEDGETWPTNMEARCWEVGPDYMEFRVYGKQADQIYRKLCKAHLAKG